MDAGKNWLSRTVDHSAASLFACAVAYSVYQLAGLAAACAAGILGFCASLLGLSRLADHSNVRLPEFALEPIVVDDADELLLTELHELLLTERIGEEGELLLEDRVAAPEADARVIRLFDPRTMPSAGDLHERIERHLDRPPSAYPDATAELHHALAELKNALR